MCKVSVSHKENIFRGFLLTYSGPVRSGTWDYCEINGRLDIQGTAWATLGSSASQGLRLLPALEEFLLPVLPFPINKQVLGTLCLKVYVILLSF